MPGEDLLARLCGLRVHPRRADLRGLEDDLEMGCFVILKWGVCSIMLMLRACKIFIIIYICIYCIYYCIVLFVYLRIVASVIDNNAILYNKGF